MISHQVSVTTKDVPKPRQPPTVGGCQQLPIAAEYSASPTIGGYRIFGAIYFWWPSTYTSLNSAWETYPKTPRKRRWKHEQVKGLVSKIQKLNHFNRGHLLKNVENIQQHTVPNTVAIFVWPSILRLAHRIPNNTSGNHHTCLRTHTHSADLRPDLINLLWKWLAHQLKLEFSRLS